MGITVRRADDGVHIVIDGKVSIEDAPLLLRSVTDNIEQLTAIHMGGAEAIDTSIIQILLMADRVVRKNGRRLCIVEPPDEIVMTFGAAGLSETFGLDYM